MPEFTHPGVFVEEVPFEATSIEGVSTSTTGFVGVARFGPIDKPFRLSSWAEFARTFGDPDDPDAAPFSKGAYLAHAVHGFFANGGSHCHVVRAADGGSLEAGLERIADIDEVRIVCVPDLVALPQAQGTELRKRIVARCEAAADRMAILDPPPELSPRDVAEWRATAGASSFAALYYPWVEVVDPVDGEPVLVPPCGHVAGVWARTDAGSGVHRTPAGEKVLEASAPARGITDAEQGVLNPEGVNCIRSFPDRGIVVWGARTMASPDDREWKYISVRRLLLFLRESIEKGTRWAVFEPNDERLWARLRTAAEHFLTDVWRSGALAGSKPEEAFFVRCDGTTNPPDLVKAGQVRIEIGFAPLRPAEFVVLAVGHRLADPA